MSFDLELINNDIKISTNGDVRVVTDTPKLRQDVLKIIITPLGSSTINPWYGCSVNDDIIGKNLPELLNDSMIRDSIFQSLENLRTLQKSQMSDQNVSLAEVIKSIIDIHAERDSDDPRKINIVVSILTARLSKIDEVFTLTA